MNGRNFARYVAAALTATLAATVAFSQTQPATRGPAENGSPAWFLQGSFPDPGGNTSVDVDGRVTVLARNAAVPRPAAAAPAPTGILPRTPSCSRSPLCGNRLTAGRQSLQRVQWQQTLGYTLTYPYALPAGTG